MLHIVMPSAPEGQEVIEFSEEYGSNNSDDSDSGRFVSRLYLRRTYNNRFPLVNIEGRIERLGNRSSGQ